MAIFKYTSLLRATPPSEESFNEIKAISDIQFRYSERGKVVNYAHGLAGWMQSPVPREKIVSSKFLVEEFKYDELAAALKMLDPRRATVGVTCRELPKSVTASFDKKEPIYGTEYGELKLSDEFLKEVSGVQSHNALDADDEGYGRNSHPRAASSWSKPVHPREA